MRVTHFQKQEIDEQIIFSADFHFKSHFNPRITLKRFYARRLKLALTQPKNFLKTGFTTTHTVWFKVPKALAITENYEEAFFLPAALFANVLQENLVFDAPVARELLNKVTGLRKNFRLTTPASDITVQTSELVPVHFEKQGQFFSLGLDSFYTLFCNPTPIKENHLIFVAGFDIPSTQTQLLETVYRGINTVAEEIAATPVFIESNLRDLSDQIVNWAKFHVTALTTVGSLLQFKKIYMSGESFDWPDWGLRYGVDTLFSRSNIAFELVGHAMTRDVKISALKKTAYLPLILKHLRVCWKNILQTKMEYNCSECQKCLRTQLTLLACDVSETPTFKPLNPQKIAAVELFTHVRNEWVILYQLLKQNENADSEILKAIEIVLEKKLLDYG